MTNDHSRLVLIASLAVWFSLLWLIYGRKPEGAGDQLQWLPHLNALLNGTTAAFLLAGYSSIRKGRIRVHIGFMSSAVATSALFLISYCIYHYHAGHTTFAGTRFMGYIYYPILISHILLSVVQVPLIGLTLLYALKKQYYRHRRVARWTLPIWLYVSLSGVAVFFFLR